MRALGIGGDSVGDLGLASTATTSCPLRGLDTAGSGQYAHRSPPPARSLGIARILPLPNVFRRRTGLHAVAYPSAVPECAEGPLSPKHVDVRALLFTDP